MNEWDVHFRKKVLLNSIRAIIRNKVCEKCKVIYLLINLMTNKTLYR
jgi:hypothetical protein